MNKKQELMLKVAQLREDQEMTEVIEVLQEVRKYLKNSPQYAEEILKCNDWTRFPPEVRAFARPPSKEKPTEEDGDDLIARCMEIYGTILIKERRRKEVRWHEIIDFERRVCKPAEKIVAQDFLHFAGQAAMRRGTFVTPKEASECRDLFLMYSPEMNMDPLPLGHSWDPESWCYFRSDVVEDPNMLTPAWDNFLRRVSDPEAYMAWDYGVWSGEYKGRQVKYTHGIGRTGKTRVSMAVINALFGGVEDNGAAFPVTNAHIKASNKQFLFSYLVGKSLVYYGDANNPTILFDEMVKMMSAGPQGDAMPAEGKGEKAVGVVLQCRMMVNSNYPPVVSDDEHVRSRLLYIYIEPRSADEPPDTEIEKKLIAEMPGYLYKARLAYEKRIKHDEIQQNDWTKQKIDELAADYYASYINLLDTKFDVTGCDEDYINGSELDQMIKRSRMLENKYDIDRFKRWLTEYSKVEKIPGKHSPDGKVRYVGIIKKGEISKCRGEGQSGGDEDY